MSRGRKFARRRTAHGASVRAVDTNVLVYAHRSDSPFHDRAASLMRNLAEGRAAWAIPWPCLYEFYSVVTSPKIYLPPSSTDQALRQIDAWLGSPSLRLLSEGVEHWTVAREVVAASRTVGPMVHDARIAALCQANGVEGLITVDRDFSRFADLPTTGLPEL